MLKNLAIILFTIITVPAFALTCENSTQKLVLTNDTTNIPFDITSAPNIISLCLESSEPDDFDRQKPGAYCWCKITAFAENPLSANWTFLKQYNTHKFNEEKLRAKKNITETEIQRQKEDTAKQNSQDCATKCQSTCESRLTTLKSDINGYYICDTAQYSATNIQCAVDAKILDIERITFFDDIAELLTKRIQIVFKRDTTNTKDISYIGEYKNKPIYIILQGNKISLGRKWYSMDKCTAK
ncbi:MAG: hypothetical protein J5608_02690 [Alphaproteobacteria bacterium]|nr:hypothetical protein [Alphaproteobacteria bacterium]